jgi:ribosomal protein S27AE
MRVYSRDGKTYFVGLDKVRPRVPLNGQTNFCPRCGGVMTRDLSDLACFWCGWRECDYFPVADTEEDMALTK